MFKFFLGTLVGCFVTYNFLIKDPEYVLILDRANELTLEIITNIQDTLRNNVENK